MKLTKGMLMQGTASANEQVLTGGCWRHIAVDDHGGAILMIERMEDDVDMGRRNPLLELNVDKLIAIVNSHVEPQSNDTDVLLGAVNVSGNLHMTREWVNRMRLAPFVVQLEGVSSFATIAILRMTRGEARKFVAAKKLRETDFGAEGTL